MRSLGKLTIALVAPSLEILGGQGVQADTLARALEREGYVVDFIPINPRFPKGLSWLKKVRYVRTVVNEAVYSASLYRLKNCDVVHVFTASYWSFLLTVAPVMAAARLYGKPVVINYHSGEADDHLSKWGALVHPFLRAAADLVVPSEYLRRVFAEHGHKAKVVPNALSLGAFTFRERHTLAPRLLSTRNLEKHYGVDTVIEAFALVQAKHPDATLEVAGTGGEDARLRGMVAQKGLKNVTFLGRVEPDKVPGLYERNDIYVNGSLIDNQPLSLLEAFSAGLPVVSTPTGDIASMIDEGKTGLLVPQRDPAAMAAGVETLLADPARALEMTRGALKKVDAHAWPHIKQGWSRIYAGEPA